MKRKFGAVAWKMGQLRGRLIAKRTLYHLERGNFRRLLGRESSKAFHKFANRQALTPHTEQIILRLTMDDKGTPWFLWAIYKITSTDPGEMKLMSIMAPDGTENALRRPDEIGPIYYRA